MRDIVVLRTATGHQWQVRRARQEPAVFGPASRAIRTTAESGLVGADMIVPEPRPSPSSSGVPT